MSPALVWRSAYSRPIVIPIILFLTVFVNLSCQCDAQQSGEIKDDELHEIDGFNLAICGMFESSKWHEIQHAFDCRRLEHREPIDATTSANCGDTRRTGGKYSRELPIREFPFYAHLVIRSADVDLECAGTLVDQKFVVTTARCVFAATRIFIVLGTSSTEAIGGWNTEADNWCFPRDYHPVDGPFHDVAVIRLREPANYTDDIQPACLSQDMQPIKQAACMVARKRAGPLERQLQGYVVDQEKCPANLPELYEPTCYQALDDKVGFCALELGTPVVCYDTCDNNSSRVQAFAVAAESFAPTPGDQCDPDRATPIQYTDLTRKSRLIRIMARTLVDVKNYPAPRTIKCVGPEPEPE